MKSVNNRSLWALDKAIRSYDSNINFMLSDKECELETKVDHSLKAEE